MKNYKNCKGCNAKSVVIKDNKPVCEYCGCDATSVEPIINKNSSISVINGNGNVVIHQNANSIITIKGNIQNFNA